MFQASQAASPTFRLPRPPPRLLTYILPCFILCLASPCVPTSATFGLTGATARGSRVLPAEIQHILPRRHNASRNLLCSKAVTRLFLTLGSPASLPQTWSHTGAACPLHLRTGRCLTHRCSVRLALGQLGPASVLGSHVVCGTVSSRTSFSPWQGAKVSLHCQVPCQGRMVLGGTHCSAWVFLTHPTDTLPAPTSCGVTAGGGATTSRGKRGLASVSPSSVTVART